MNIRDLEYFLAVAELGHFGKAAKRCRVSQPTLSGQIKKLEERLGVTLLERTNRKVLLTPVGSEIAASAERLLLELDDIRNIANNSKDPSRGTFHLGAIPTVASYIFPVLLPKLKAALPNLKLILHEEKTDVLLKNVVSGKADVSIVALPIEDSALEYKKLFRDKFFVAVPENHPLAQLRAVKQSDLKQHRFLLLEEGHCMRDHALDYCHSNSLDEQQDFRATSLETLRNMVRAGSGITFMPEVAIRENDEGIRYVPFKAKAPTREIALAWRKTSMKKSIVEKVCELF